MSDDVRPLEEIFGALGSQGLYGIVDHFVWRMRCDRLIEPRLSSADHVVPTFLGWLQMAFGGPSVHDGRDISDARRHLRTVFIEPLTRADFYVMGSHLIVVATAASVPDWVTESIAAHWMDLMPEVVPSIA